MSLAREQELRAEMRVTIERIEREMRISIEKELRVVL